MGNGQFKLIDVIEEMCIQTHISLQPVRVARDIMNADVKTLTLDHTMGDCLKFMEVRRVRHAPVIDLPYEGEKDPYFVGLVSQRDVLRLNAPDAEETDTEKTDLRALRQLLTQIVARKPRSVALQTPIQDVIAIMTRHHIDMVPVLADADLAGIITTADLMKLLLRLDKVVHRLCQELKKGTPPPESSAKAEILFSWVLRTAQDIMTKEVICLGPQDDLATAMAVMQGGEFRHLPVTDEQGRFVGLVSDRDILRNLPFGGRRPPSPPKRFREHLFATDPRTKSLQLPLERIMVRKVLHILPGHSVPDAADTLVKKKISCLPVVDEQKKLRGIITVTNLMRALLAAYEPPAKEALTQVKTASAN
ncbi:MAG: CBS domain-containing protein [Planctomycetota bacterium]|jgi:CBS domain-containing protein